MSDEIIVVRHFQKSVKEMQDWIGTVNVSSLRMKHFFAVTLRYKTTDNPKRHHSPVLRTV